MRNRFLLGVLMDPEPGAGGGGAPAFDAAAFEARMLASVNSIVAGAIAKIKPEPKPEPKADPIVDPKATANPHEFKLNQLTEQLATEKAARLKSEEASAKKELDASIRTALTGFQYAKSNGADKAFKLLAPDITRAEDGSLVGPNGQGLAEYVKDQLEKNYDELLAPLPKGGAGASAGQRGGTPTVTLESIHAGAKPEALSAARDAIAMAMGIRVQR